MKNGTKNLICRCRIVSVFVIIFVSAIRDRTKGGIDVFLPCDFKRDVPTIIQLVLVSNWRLERTHLGA